ncbi:hypothetical protein BVY03_03165 [bacterium K02(2017)]|nr:hypothetical protein BVY03_03165 [bacterium K02(2017)]
MTNNDIIRRIRYAFDFNDTKMIAIFNSVGHIVSREQIINWLKKDDEKNYSSCNDTHMALFLNGLIIEKRGKKNGPQAEHETQLTNNIILIKLKIALNLKAEDVLKLLSLADFTLGKHELSALFRKPGHKHYRECKDQILRYFLKGMQIKHRNNHNA